jgi:eukaryotic-like serine/threonine-protein kinase
MKFPVRVLREVLPACSKITGLMFVIVPLCLISAGNTPAHGQTSDDVSSSSTVAASSPADWTQFLRDNMQRWNPYETAIGVNNVGSMKLKWKSSAGGLLKTYPQSSPAVTKGVIYFGSENGSFYALDPDTGAKLWSYATGGAVKSSPAVVDGVAYFGSDDGNVYALNASTGAKMWSYDTGNLVESSPAVANGAVYIGGGDCNAYALNASTGAKLWSFSTFSTEFPGCSINSPAVVGGVVYFPSDDGNVYARNTNTGAKLWTSDAGGFLSPPRLAPVVANGVLYICNFDGYVFALDASTGAQLWSYSTGGVYFDSALAVANGVVCIPTLEPATNTGVIALNASTGALLWQNSDVQELGASSPAVANGVVYIGCAAVTGGDVCALNANTGALLWSYKASGDFSSSPATMADTFDPNLANNTASVSLTVQ